MEFHRRYLRRQRLFKRPKVLERGFCKVGPSAPASPRYPNRRTNRPTAVPTADVANRRRHETRVKGSGCATKGNWMVARLIRYRPTTRKIGTGRWIGTTAKTGRSGCLVGISPCIRNSAFLYQGCSVKDASIKRDPAVALLEIVSVHRHQSPCYSAPQRMTSGEIVNSGATRSTSIAAATGTSIRIWACRIWSRRASWEKVATRYLPSATFTWAMRRSVAASVDESARRAGRCTNDDGRRQHGSRNFNPDSLKSWSMRLWTMLRRCFVVVSSLFRRYFVAISSLFRRCFIAVSSLFRRCSVATNDRCRWSGSGEDARRGATGRMETRLSRSAINLMAAVSHVEMGSEVEEEGERKMIKEKVRETTQCDAIKRKTKRRISYTQRVVVIVNSRDLSVDYAACVTMVNVFNRSRHVPSIRPMLHQHKTWSCNLSNAMRSREKDQNNIKGRVERERALSIDLSLCGKCI